MDTPAAGHPRDKALDTALRMTTLHPLHLVDNRNDLDFAHIHRQATTTRELS